MKNTGSKPDSIPSKSSDYQSNRTVSSEPSYLLSSKFPADGEISEVQLTVARFPDGGWGWIVVISSFFCNMIVDGLQYNFANVMEPIEKEFKASTAAVALAGSLMSGFYNFCGPVGSALANKFGFRMVVISGALTAVVGLSTSYFVQDLYVLYVTYGFLVGMGFGMIYMASVITTSMYFDKYRALAASISVCGTGIGTFIFAPVGQITVNEYGWRLAFVIQSAVVFLCMLFGMVFKPLDVITIASAPTDESSLSEASVKTYRNRAGSIYPHEERGSLLPNAAFPTLKQVLQAQEQRTGPTSTRQSVYRTRRISAVASVGQSMLIRTAYPSIDEEEEEEEILEESKKETFYSAFSIKFHRCCFNFWHCRRRHKVLTIGDRPMYRDDIFYESDLAHLPNFSPEDRVGYHLSVTRMAAVKDVKEHMTQQCVICSEAVLRTCATMVGFNLLKSKKFVFLCISGFMFTMGMFIPYVFLRKLAADAGISADTSVWLVSAMGISNTLGRITSGIIKSFTKLNAALIVIVSLFISGSSCFIPFLSGKMESLFLFSCFFGFFTAPFVSLRPVIIVEFLGLDKLTNAFGLVLLSQGIASILGPPLAGYIDEKSGQTLYPFLLAGCLTLISGLAVSVSVILNRRSMKS